MDRKHMKIDHLVVFDFVKPGSSVLDLGCGDGELLSILAKEKKCRVQGIELDEQAIYKCVARGLSVLHGDIDADLVDYGDKSFDYVILNQSFQQVRNPDVVLREALRVGKEVIVSFPNFAHYSARLQMFFRGRTPVTPSLPWEWYDTPNLHFLSISDFIAHCRKRHIKIKQAAYTGLTWKIPVFPNILARNAFFLLSDGDNRQEDKNGK
jgi:methionine biosynthesis protein MetW